MVYYFPPCSELGISGNSFGFGFDFTRTALDCWIRGPKSETGYNCMVDWFNGLYYVNLTIMIMSNLDQKQVALVDVEGVVGSSPELPPSTQQEQPVATAEGSSEPSQQQQEDPNPASTGGKPVDKKTSDSKMNGTSTLTAHILSCLKNPHCKDTRQTLLTLQNFFASHDENEGKGNLGVWKFNQDDIRKGLSYMLIVDELPFKHVEGMGFKRFMSVACLRFHIPSRWTVNRDCYQMFLYERLQLKNIWNNRNNDWILHKRIINLVPVCGHKGDYISKTLENCLLGWDIKNVFTVTMVNAAHVINLVVSNGLKEMHDSVKKVRDYRRYIRNSPSRLKKFKDLTAADDKLGTKKSLCLDVATRWNSTSLMLDTACLFQSVF
ncbi:zinc finger BED domain-containing protein RICESLEEPER 2-like [Mercurialis annua]|uniref:zinc finger BED domain-containing protein RICESLEEPER 2-like n=1 Tax=Mercurialis annua TaxID=3986 RepID=UPI002160E5B5|nr:zinc finger BED domain-containing protein RICESLEEPER 2-like [Mercurialis annua]